MTDDEIYDVMHTIIGLVTGFANENIIPADDNGKASNGSYASIKVGSTRGQRGQANIKLSDTDLVTAPIGQVRDVEHDIRPQVTAGVSVNFYRANALSNATLLLDANKRPDISQLLFESKIGWFGTDAINNLTALQSKEFEERSQITINIGYELSSKVITNAIYSAQVIVENEDSEQLADITIQTETGV